MSSCSAIPTAKIQELLDAWIAAELAVTTGQNYSVEGLSVSRVDADLITKKINLYSRELCSRQTAAAGGRVGVMTPKWG